MTARSGRARRFHAPGRANLIGEHTDHTGGLVLPAAIDRGVTLTARPARDRITLTSTGAGGRVDVPANGGSWPSRGWGRFVGAVAAQLDVAGRPAVGLAGHLDADLPQGAGLASSAALEVVVATALCAVAGFELAPLELAAACQRAEHHAVGVPSGIMDQAAAVLGQAGHAVRIDCGTLAHHPVPLPNGHALLIVDSGVRRELEQSAYAKRTRELQAALPALGRRRPADVDPAELPSLLAGVDPVPARRLRHVVTENSRVVAVEAALRAGDLARVGELFAAGHASLRDDFAVTIPQLDLLVELASDAGATAARMTGAGFGGAIVAIVRAGDARAIADHVTAAYTHRYPDHHAVALMCRAADGAREL